MKFMDFFKTKQKKVEEPQKKALEVPAAPPKKEDLPTFPSPDEVPEFGGEIKEAAPEIQKKTPVSVENKEDYAMKKVSEELGERGELKLKKPIFVYLDIYKEMMKDVSIIQNTLKEGSDSLTRISEFKEDEDKEFHKWEGQIKDIQRKLIYADKTLFAAQK